MFDDSMHKDFKRLINVQHPELLRIDGLGGKCDLNLFSKEFFGGDKDPTSDHTSDPNSNVGKRDILTFHTEKSKGKSKLQSYYDLWCKLGEDIRDEVIAMQIQGDIYIHDMHGIADKKPYCFNFSTYDILLNGLDMVESIKSGPPKSLMSFKHQVEQFLIIAGNSIVGASGIADFLLCVSYYVDRMLQNGYKDHHIQLADEKSCWTYTKESLAAFVYTVNQPSRGDQSCFTNVSIYDMPSLEELKGIYTFLKPDTAMKVQKLYMEVMSEELNRTPITFPVTSACITTDDNRNIRDEETLEVVAKYNNKHGWINYFTSKSTVLSSCCRLKSDTESEYFNSFGAGSMKIGSIGVVTINLPRLIHENEFGYVEDLRKLVSVAATINHIKRELIQEAIVGGFHPLYTLGYMDIRKQYSTVGIIGVNEAVKLLGHEVTSDEGVHIVTVILEVINEENRKQAELHGTPHNCEQVPAENASHKLASKDLILYKEYLADSQIYSNQFIPLTEDVDMITRMRVQGTFDKHLTGGAIAHINVDGRIEVADEVALVKEAAKMGVVYWARNAKLALCSSGHFEPTMGRETKCTKCGGAITKHFTRVVGFLTPVDNWHSKRRNLDYPHRKFYGGIKNEHCEDAVQPTAPST